MIQAGGNLHLLRPEEWSQHRTGEFFRQVKEYASTQLDQGETWRFETPFGPVYVMMTREWPDGWAETFDVDDRYWDIGT